MKKQFENIKIEFVNFDKNIQTADSISGDFEGGFDDFFSGANSDNVDTPIV